MARKALIIDDEVDLGQLLAEHLRRWGFEPTVLTEGKNAVDWVRREKPGLILLDLMMPRMSGSEFRMVQKVDPLLCSVPVVLLSADGRIEEKARALETHGAIKKPIDLDQLLEVIQRFNVSKMPA